MDDSNTSAELSAPAINGDGFLEPSRSIYMLLSVTRRCNLRCSGCYLLQQQENFFESSELDLESAKQIVEHYWRQGVRQVVPNAEGEPLLYRHFRSLVEYVNSLGFPYRPWLVTNGVLLARHAEVVADNACEVLISLDGPDAKRYNAFRGGNPALFDKVTAGIRTLVAIAGNKARRPAVIINYVVTRERLDELEPMIAVAERLGVDAIKFTNYHELVANGRHTPLYSRDSAVRRKLETVMSRGDYQVAVFLPTLFGRQTPPFHCRMLASIVIGERGDYAPCCRITPNKRWGNFFSSPEKHNTEELRSFRKQVLSARTAEQLPSPCRTCSHLSPVRASYLTNERQWVFTRTS